MSRFLSSSEKSSVMCISLGLSWLLWAIQAEVSVLFSTALQSMAISEQWTARSWVINDIAQFIPLVHVWNSQYASQSPVPPQLLAMDCEHLYTKIDLQDMRVKVLDMVQHISNLPEHARSGHVAVKVGKDKHAQWLKAHEVPADYHDRANMHNNNDADDFVIFDLVLLDNLFIMFGPSLCVRL